MPTYTYFKRMSKVLKVGFSNNPMFVLSINISANLLHFFVCSSNISKIKAISILIATDPTFVFYSNQQQIYFELTACFLLVTYEHTISNDPYLVRLTPIYFEIILTYPS